MVKNNLEHRKEYRKAHKKEIDEYNKKWNGEHSDYYGKWRKEHLEECLESHRKDRRIIKLKVIGHYSPELKCVKCGYSDIRALQIDHIKGGGLKHYKEIGMGNLYPWLIKNNFPKGFQVLCANCNWIKRYENGECKGKHNIETRI